MWLENLKALRNRQGFPTVELAMSEGLQKVSESRILTSTYTLPLYLIE